MADVPLADVVPSTEFEDVRGIVSLICGSDTVRTVLLDKPRNGMNSVRGLMTGAPEELVVLNEDDVRLPHVFEGNPVRFYAGVPVVASDRYLFGTLGVLDRTPRNLSPKQGAALLSVGRQLGKLIETRSRLRSIESENVRLNALATTDGLTGLTNRRMFQDRLDVAIQQSRLSATPLSLLLLDVDYFKPYNDMYGHPAGDEVLRQVGRLLARTVRASDVAARYGGEEFAVILPETDGDTASILGEILRETISGHPWPERPITISIGGASMSATIGHPQELVAAADRALYRSKKDGRDRVTMIDSPDEE